MLRLHDGVGRVQHTLGHVVLLRTDLQPPFGFKGQPMRVLCRRPLSLCEQLAHQAGFRLPQIADQKEALQPAEAVVQDAQLQPPDNLAPKREALVVDTCGFSL